MYEWLPYPNNSLVQQIGGTSSKYFQNARSVLFHFTDNPAKDSLTKVFNQGYAGCVHFHVSWNCHMKRRAMKWLYYTVHSGRFEKIIFDLEVQHFFILTKILSSLEYFPLFFRNLVIISMYIRFRNLQIVSSSCDLNRLVF